MLLPPPTDPSQTTQWIVAQLGLVQTAITAILANADEETRAEFARAMNAAMEVGGGNPSPGANMLKIGAMAWLNRVMPEIAENAGLEMPELPHNLDYNP